MLWTSHAAIRGCEENTMNATITAGNRRETFSSKLRTCAVALFALGVLLPSGAWAWDYSVAGQVGGWQQYQDGSFGVLLVGAPDLCPNLADDYSRKRGMVTLTGFTVDGMKAFLASLMEARISSRVIRLYVASQSGQCIVVAADF
jgi:hypothetical protein